MATAVKKVVLAYSGGLDTSIILKWLQETYACEVVTFTADLGQGEELEPARKKAEMLGIKEIFVEDLREEFVRDFVFPMGRPPLSTGCSSNQAPSARTSAWRSVLWIRTTSSASAASPSSPR